MDRITSWEDLTEDRRGRRRGRRGRRR
jgi:hypothetical protein